MPQAQSGSQGLVPGVFIPAAAFKSLQERANANSNQPTSSNQGYQPANVKPQPSYQPSAKPNNQGYQPNTNVQPVSNVQYQQPAMTIQPNSQQLPTNQAQPLIVDRIGQPNSNQPTVVMTNPQNTRPGQQIIYVQQQQPNRPTYVVAQQPQQPIIVAQQPQNGGIVYQNPSGGQTGNVVVTNPSNGYQPQNPSNVYTLIPLNTQNQNPNSGSYLIPIQSGSSNPIVLSSGK